jgi:hypothetical protein
MRDTVMVIPPTQSRVTKSKEIRTGPATTAIGTSAPVELGGEQDVGEDDEQRVHGVV